MSERERLNKIANQAKRERDIKRLDESLEKAKRLIEYVANDGDLEVEVLRFRADRSGIIFGRGKPVGEEADFAMRLARALEAIVGVETRLVDVSDDYSPNRWKLVASWK